MYEFSRYIESIIVEVYIDNILFICSYTWTFTEITKNHNNMVKKQLSSEQKAHIVGLRQANTPHRQIMAEYRISRQRICKIINQHKDSDSVQRLSGSGKTRKTSEREDRIGSFQSLYVIERSLLHRLNSSSAVKTSLMIQYTGASQGYLSLNPTGNYWSPLSTPIRLREGLIGASGILIGQLNNGEG